MRIAAVVAVALAATSSPHAALDVRLAVTPTAPRVGERAIVVLRAYWPLTRPDGTCCDLVPAEADYPFRVQLVTRTRANIVRATRTADPNVWQATFRFPRRGVWRVRIANNYYDTRCQRIGCTYNGAELLVRVR